MEARVKTDSAGSQPKKTPETVSAPKELWLLYVKDWPPQRSLPHASGLLFAGPQTVQLGERLVVFIREHDIRALDVAGSRGSKEPGVAVFVKRALEDAFYPRVVGMVLRG